MNSRVGGGTMLDYRSRGFTISLDQTGIVGVTLSEAPENSASSRTFPGATDKGIQMGSSSADIQREYDIPESGSAAQGIMTYLSLGLSFNLLEDRLVMLIMTRPLKTSRRREVLTGK